MHLTITLEQLRIFQERHYTQRIAESTGAAKIHCKKQLRELEGERQQPVQLYNEVKMIR